MASSCGPCEQVPASQRVTVDAGEFAELQGHAFATVVESDVFVAVDRLVQWDQARGSHAEHGLPGPSTEWYFAEGATYTGFALFYLLQNPGDASAHVTVTYLREAPLAPLRADTSGAAAFTTHRLGEPRRSRPRDTRGWRGVVGHDCR